MIIYLQLGNSSSLCPYIKCTATGGGGGGPFPTAGPTNCLNIVAYRLIVRIYDIILICSSFDGSCHQAERKVMFEILKKCICKLICIK